ncbi:MAG TPA: hypothetical protein VE177_01850 [Candidatus Binatus sp.]|nr:hypothetical protein [Candidatus Binatus sp.]
MSDVCLARFDEEAIEPFRERNSEFFSARLEAIDNEPVRDLKREFLSRTFEAETIEPVRDLSNEMCSAKFEDGLREATRPLPTPLVVEPARLRVALRDLRKEVCLARLEVRLKFAVTAAAQERGLELQTIFPESTLATTLPILVATETLRVLKKEFFSARLDARFNNPLKDLK